MNIYVRSLRGEVTVTRKTEKAITRSKWLRDGDDVNAERNRAVCHWHKLGKQQMHTHTHIEPSIVFHLSENKTLPQCRYTFCFPVPFTIALSYEVHADAQHYVCVCVCVRNRKW